MGEGTEMEKKEKFPDCKSVLIENPKEKSQFRRGWK